MKLLLVNGSPKGKTGNTELLMKYFINGYESVEGNEIIYNHLNRAEEIDNVIKNFKDCDTCIIALPLYIFSVPGRVMELFENLQKRDGKTKIGFIVHSGFPEAMHSRALENMLKCYPAKIGAEYIGTVVKGGSARLIRVPESQNAKLFSMFYTLGAEFASTGAFDKKLVKKLASPERFHPLVMAAIKMKASLGSLNKNWDVALKKFGTYEKRYDKPYAG